MKKSILLWISAVLMLSVGMMSCSNDDENTDETAGISRGGDVEALDENHKNILGEWQLLYYRGGNIAIQGTVEPGEVTATFTKDGVVKINNDKNYPFPYATGSYEYSFEEMTPYKANESRTVLVIGESTAFTQYTFVFDDGMLRLWQYDCYDGFDYTFKKVK